MKKNKIWLFILIGFLTLCCNNKVMAADDGFVGYIECVYQKHNNTTQKKNFLYSEVILSNVDLSTKLYYYTNELNYGLAEYGYVKNEIKFARETFKKIYEENNQSCPKYAVKTKNDEYMVFDNKVTTYCGNNWSNCSEVYTLENEYKRILYNGDDEWSLYRTGKKACDKVQSKLYFSGRNLKAEIWYPSDSSYYFTSAKKPVTVTVTGNMNGVYKFLTNQTIVLEDNMYIIGKAGKEEFGVGSRTYSANGCTFFGNQSITHKKTCTSLDTTNVFKTQANAYNEIKVQFDNFAKDNVTVSGNKYQAKDYSNISNANSLLSTATSINEWLNKEKKGGTLLNAYDAYNQAMKNVDLNGICGADKDKLEDLQNNLAKSNEDLQAKITALQDSLKKIKARLDSLGATDSAAKVEQYLENSEQVLQEVKRYYAVTKPTDLLGNVSIEIREGCAVITEDFRNWLIQLLDIVKIAALVLTIILGMIDFFKGVASGDADAMKKVTKNFSRRLIAVVLLFLLPVLIEFILNIVNINGVEADNPFCGIK